MGFLLFCLKGWERSTFRQDDVSEKTYEYTATLNLVKLAPPKSKIDTKNGHLF